MVCIDNFVNGTPDALYEALVRQTNVQRLDLDLTDFAAVANLPDVDVAFHMAALNGTQRFYERPFDVMLHSTIPTINLLQRYCKGAPLKRFIYAGSSESYASTVSRFGWIVPTEETVPLGIDDVLNVRWSYGASKLHGEVAVVAAAAQFDIPDTIARIHNAYGPRMGEKHVVPDFLNRARNGVYSLYGYDDTRTFIYVDDATAILEKIGSEAACRNEIINVGGAREIKILELAKIIMSVCGMHGSIELHSSPPGSVKRRAPDLTKLRSLVGFEETWTLEDGLYATAKFYLSK